MDYEWHGWLEQARKAGHLIDVTNPAVCRAIKAASDAGKLDGIEREDYDYLLDCFRRNYEEVLELLGPEEHEKALPVLLEFGAMGQVLEADSSSAKLLRRWASQRQARPRSLESLIGKKDWVRAQAAPLRGVGSPHGVSVTIYYTGGSTLPARICCAGATADPVLNSKIFSSMFVTALACDVEPTFVVTGGAALSLRPQPRQSDDSPQRSLLSATVGPDGPVQPRADSVGLGMEPHEAMQLVTVMLSTMEEETGLVRVRRWDYDDALRLEERLAAALRVRQNRVHVINSDPATPENMGVTHFIPLLHRDEEGEVVPVAVEIPYRVLGAGTIVYLLREARDSYMRQLIANARRREATARDAFEKHDRAVKLWQAMSEAEKAQVCRETPVVTITQAYDFELGIIVPIDPQESDRRTYEEDLRPPLRDSAKRYAEKFAELCEKLSGLNREGGRADVVTFKLLVDSLLRRAPLPVESPAFRKEYERWVETTWPVVWAAVEEWAGARGLASETLAADNIVFNARLDPKRDVVVVEPLVAVDLHDFVARVDCQTGLVEILPAGRTPTLGEALIPDAARGVESLDALHGKFEAWVEAKYRLSKAHGQLKSAEGSILSDARLRALLRLQQGKQQLFRGHADRAAETLDGIRSLDYTAGYFWGAVANQCLHLSKSVRPDNMPKGERAERLLNHAVGTLIGHLTGVPEEEDTSLEGALARLGVYVGGDALSLADHLGQIRWRTTRANAPVAPKAAEYLRQLQAKDPRFVKRLTARGANVAQVIAEMEAATLKVKPEEEARMRAAAHAVSSLELMALAEELSSAADELPLAGEEIKKVQEVVAGLLDKADSLSFVSPSCDAQIKELPQMLGGGKSRARLAEGTD
jgi:hypothetical protein